MIRWTLVLLCAATLTACATDYRGYDRGYGHSYAETTYVGGGSYYNDTYRGRGDYYYGVGASAYSYPLWVDNPYYYSLFWPLQRSFHDPFWHPGFYYGVTYFPRNYFSVSLYGGHRSRYYGSFGTFGSFAYSPYRLAWVDHYYDWYPHHRYYPRHVSGYYAPRFGNARHEAERLSHWGRSHTRSSSYDGGLIADHSRYEQRAPRNPERDADYRGRTGARMDPGVRGFNRDADLRRQGDYAESRGADYGDRATGRVDPGVRGFNRDADLRRQGDYAETRGADHGGRGTGRVDPGVRGFNRDTDLWRPGDYAEARDGDYGGRGNARIDPGVRGFDRQADLRRQSDAASPRDDWRSERSAQGFAGIERERSERAAAARGDYRRADVEREVSLRGSDAVADRGWQRVERGSYARAQSAQPQQRMERPAVRGGEREYYPEAARDDGMRGGYRVDARPLREPRGEAYGAQARSAPAPQQWAPEPRAHARPVAVPRGEVHVGGGDPRATGMGQREQYYAPPAPAYQAPPRGDMGGREAPVRGEARSERAEGRGSREASDEDRPRRW
jgi:hypothetical protein